MLCLRDLNIKQLNGTLRFDLATLSRNISVEKVVEEWPENAYCPYFFGCHEFGIIPPCNTKELIHFRKRIGLGSRKSKIDY